MALTMLDPDTALIVIDLQKGIAGYPLIHPLGEVVGRTRILLDAFRGRGLPVVLVNVAGSAPGGRNRDRVPAAPSPKDGPISCPNSIGNRTTSS